MPVHVVTAPDEVPAGDDHYTVVIFLAGGITGCPNWQPDFLAMATQRATEIAPDLDIWLLNPRRPQFPAGDNDASKQQTAWEFHALESAHMAAFWFPASYSPQPIALYELGSHARRGLGLAVGCDPAYPRRFDVVQQLSWLRPDITVRTAMRHVVTDVIAMAVAAAANPRA